MSVHAKVRTAPSFVRSQAIAVQCEGSAQLIDAFQVSGEIVVSASCTGVPQVPLVWVTTNARASAPVS